MMYRFDVIRRSKARTDAERTASSVTQSLHVHQTLGHGPVTYGEFKEPLFPFTEELGESALKQDKNFGMACMSYTHSYVSVLLPSG
jgi:hypothetical protein